jgi:putative oxidoreductase
MDAVLVIGRILFALIFINMSIMHLTKVAVMAGYATSKKVPAAKLATIVTGLMILVGGLYIAFGVYADLGALLIAIFLIPTAFMMHAFWKETDESAKQNEMNAFFKDIALAGAALIIFVLIGSGADFGPSITGAFFNF